MLCIGDSGDATDSIPGPCYENGSVSEKFEIRFVRFSWP